MSDLEKRLLGGLIKAPQKKEKKEQSLYPRTMGGRVVTPRPVKSTDQFHPTSNLKSINHETDDFRVAMGGYLAPTFALNSMTPGQDFNLGNDINEVVWNMKSDLVITPDMITETIVIINQVETVVGLLPLIHATDPFAMAPYPNDEGRVEFRPFDVLDPSKVPCRKKDITLSESGVIHGTLGEPEGQTQSGGPELADSAYTMTATIYVMPHPDYEILMFRRPLTQNSRETWIKIDGVTSTSPAFGGRISLEYVASDVYRNTRVGVQDALGVHFIDSKDYSHTVRFGSQGLIANNNSGGEFYKRDTAFIVSAAGPAIVEVVVDRDQDGVATAYGRRYR